MNRPALLLAFCMFCAAAPVMAQETDSRMLFDSIDANSDKFLSKKEFLGARIMLDREKIILLFPNMAHPSQMKEEELRARLFDQLDINRDGLLSHDEVGRVLPNIVQIRF